jgi:hypothetical protein
MKMVVQLVAKTGQSAGVSRLLVRIGERAESYWSNLVISQTPKSSEIRAEYLLAVLCRRVQEAASPLCTLQLRS